MNYRNNSSHPRLNRKVSTGDKLRWFAMKHYYHLILLLVVVALLSFVLLCFLFVGATESGMYYNHLLEGNL